MSIVREFLRNRIAAWFGVLGLTLSLLGALEPFVQLVEFARLLVEQWHAIARAIFAQLFAIWGLKIGIIAATLLTAAAPIFVLGLTSISINKSKSLVLSFVGRAISFVAVMYMFVFIFSASLHKTEPSLFAGSTAPSIQVQAELEVLAQFNNISEELGREKEKSNDILLWLKRAYQLCTATPELTILILSYGFLLAAIGMAIFIAEPWLLLRRLFDACSLIFIVVSLSYVSPYVIALRSWFIALLHNS